jgi:ElaB/YqjD/DUF883 family membrane-anchored ribosome-binding protein
MENDHDKSQSRRSRPDLNDVIAGASWLFRLWNSQSRRPNGRHGMRETTNGKEEWKAAMEKAQELLEQGREEMARAAAMAKEKGGEAWEAAQKKTREAWAQARAKGLNAWDDVQESGEEAWNDAEKLVKKYPSRAIGISLLAGLVIGLLLTRDSD